MSKVKAIATATKIIHADKGQAFYKLPKSIELWQDEPLQRIARWDRARVLWIMPA